MHASQHPSRQRWPKLRWLLALAVLLPAGSPITKALSAAAGPSGPIGEQGEPKRPNVVCVLADDQGYGDFGFLGNKDIQTPNLDRMAANSTWMPRFYVTPVCSSTRASLMTGRYHRRAGVERNGAEMFSEEITLAESFREAGYATGIFGKWHLGRHHPRRPMDQGFDEVLSFPGGVMRELEEQPISIRYTDPRLLHNGVLTRHEGFSTDIFFDAAIDWIEEQAKKDKPFFAYLTPAAPHGPYDDIPVDGLARYTKEQQERLGQLNLNIYALVSKIDQNVGKLSASLGRLGLSENTILIYLSDNGPSHVNEMRYMAEVRGRKGEIFEGGVKTPLLVQWPGVLDNKRIDSTFGSVIDLAPTLLDACGIETDQSRFDGRSLWQLWQGQEAKSPARKLVIQITRMGNPDSNWAVIAKRWKLAQPGGFKVKEDADESIVLYDLLRDPMEQEPLQSPNARTLERMQQAFVDWEQDVLKGLGRSSKDRLKRSYKKKAKRFKLRDPDPIVIDGEIEDPTLLSKQLGPSEPYVEWMLEAKESGRFNLDLRFAPRPEDGRIELLLERYGSAARGKPLQERNLKVEVLKGATSHTLEGIELEQGIWRLAPFMFAEEEPRIAELGVWQVWVEKLD